MEEIDYLDYPKQSNTNAQWANQNVDNSTHNNQFIWPLTLLGILAGIAIAFSIIGFFYQKSQTDKLYTEYRLMEYYTQNEDATLIALGLKNKDQTYQESLKHHLKQEHE